MTITLSGENRYAIDLELHKLVNDFVDRFGDFGLSKLDAEEKSFHSIKEAIVTEPFLAERKLVVVKNPQASKETCDQIDDLVDQVSGSSDLILVAPSLDKRLKIYKVLKTRTDFRDFPALDKPHLVRWAVNRADELGGHIDTNSASLLVDRIGMNQTMLNGELEKLILFKPNVTTTAIEQLTDSTPQSKIFDLIDAAFAGNAKKALELYDEQRLMKVEPQQIIALLSWQLHALALIISSGQMPAGQITSKSQLNPFVIQKCQGLARRVSLGKLKSMVADLLIIDTRIKTENIDADEALKNYLLKIDL